MNQNKTRKSSCVTLSCIGVTPVLSRTAGDTPVLFGSGVGYVNVLMGSSSSCTSLADVGDSREARSPSRPKFLHFLGENWSNSRLAPPSGLAPHLGNHGSATGITPAVKITSFICKGNLIETTCCSVPWFINVVAALSCNKSFHFSGQ